MDKILTIVIPTYNMEKYLDKCLSSLIISDENMQLLEVLVINDGSKDRSSEIAHSYEKRYPQTFRVIDKENGNYGSCINRGLKEVTGKYIKVLDADDYFVISVFDDFVSFLKSQETDLVINDFCIVDDEGKRLSDYSFNLPIGKTFELSWIKNGMHGWLWHQAITYRTEIFSRIKYRQTEGISYTDDEWSLLPISMVSKVIYFPYYMYQYLRGREGQTFNPSILVRDFDMRIKVTKAILKGYVELCDRSSKDACDFMECKLLCRLKPLYLFYLIKHRNREGIKKLMELDLYIKNTSNIIFDQSNNISVNYLNWRFVRNWRKSNYNSHTLMLTTLAILEKVHKYTYDASVPKMPKNLKRND